MAITAAVVNELRQATGCEDAETVEAAETAKEEE